MFSLTGSGKLIWRISSGVTTVLDSGLEGWMMEGGAVWYVEGGLVGIGVAEEGPWLGVE